MEKEVKMNGKAANTPKKYSYEELNNICSNLFQQNKNLQEQLQQLNMLNAFKRLDYLFRVISNVDVFGGKDDSFVVECIKEIKYSILGTQEPKETEETSKED